MRPIAISETWYRFAEVYALQTYGRGIGAGLAPLQVGVGTPGGTETVAHALASALAEDPETVVISMDMANAFNSFHRAAMLAAVQQGGGLPRAAAGSRRNGTRQAVAATTGVRSDMTVARALSTEMEH